MNPFLEPSYINIKNKVQSFLVKEGDQCIIEATGDVRERVISKSKEYVKEDFVALFIHELREELGFDLPPASHKMWMILMLVYVDKESQTVYYHYEDSVCNQTLSRATYYLAIKPLIDNNIIAKHERLPFTYYVNPIYFFNGNRLKIVNSILRK